MKNSMPIFIGSGYDFDGNLMSKRSQVGIRIGYKFNIICKMPNVQKHKKTDGFLKILMVRVLDCLIKIYQKSSKKRSRKQTFICDGFLIDFGPILEPFWGRKSKENRSKLEVERLGRFSEAGRLCPAIMEARSY